MKRYEIEMNGKKYINRGNNTYEAMEKFCRRMVFGNPLVCNVSVKMIDADTQGEIWATYKCDNNHA